MQFLSGVNQLNNQRNPLLNIMSVPTGQPFGMGPVGANGYDGKGFVNQHVNKMNAQMPSTMQKVGNWGGKMNPQAGAALNNNIGQIHGAQLAQNKISLLRNPVTTGGPQAQLKAQVGAGEQSRDLESLSNIYLQNAFGQLGMNNERIGSILQFLTHAFGQ